MKIAVTADLQFDTYDHLSRIDPETGITTRLRDQLACFNWIVTTAVKDKCDKLVVLGDVFDSRTEIDVSVLDSVCQAFAKARKKIDIMLMVGNHDSYLRTPHMHSLHTVGDADNITDRPEIYNPRVMGARFALVPWFDDYSKVEYHVKTMVGNADYLFAHVLVEGAVPQAKGLPLAALQPTKFKQVLLGDCHEPKVLAKNVRYVGSPMQIDYRDAGQERGFCILDTTKNKVEFIENDFSPKFHIVDGISTDIEVVSKNDFVRVKTDDPALSAKMVKKMKEKTAWVESTHVEVESDEPRLKVHTKDTHEEVLRRYCEYHGIDDNDELVSVGLKILGEVL